MLGRLARRKIQKGKRTEVDAIDLNDDEPEPSSGDLIHRDSPVLGADHSRIWKKLMKVDKERREKEAKRMSNMHRPHMTGGR